MAGLPFAAAALALTLAQTAAAGDTGSDSQQPKRAAIVWQGRAIEVETVDGWAIAEGDIALGRLAELKNPALAAKREAAFGARVWQAGRVPYVVDAAITQQRDCLKDALAEWNSRTPLRWVERTTEPDYVIFRQSPIRLSFSQIGLIGGPQEIYLEAGDCALGLYTIIVHEMGHAAGLFHEHQRPDRQRFIRVLPENTNRPTVFQDLLQITGSPYGLYDYASVMHYGPLGGSPKGEPVIDTIPKGIPTWMDIGRGPKLSPGDLDALQRMYGVTPEKTTISTNPPGLDVIIDGVRRATPAVFNWEAGSTHSLEAVPTITRDGARYEFARWNNDGRPSQTIVAGVVTHFAANYTAYVRVRGAANVPERGTVTVAPLNGEKSEDGLWRIGTPLQATATPAPGFYLARWGMGRGSRNPLPFPVFYPDPAITEFIGEFEPVPTLTINSNPQGLRVLVDGTVMITPAEVRWEPGSEHTVEYEKEQIIQDSRYRLDRLRTEAVALAVNITGPPFNASMSASFSVEHRVKVSPLPEAGGTVTVQPASSDGFYAAEQRVELKAIPNPGFVFKGWRPENLGTEAQVELALPGPLDAVAEFAPVTEQ